MVARCLMFMGTGSDVGKSLIVAGLCRLLANRGISVAPFKPQNMSNNAAVTADGGEIGRAQALQARAARLTPLTAMNPVLLKPEHDSGAQVVLRGKRVSSLPARDYFAKRQTYLPAVTEAFRELAASHELVLIEGAGSASETNLRAGDIANFGFAEAVGAPVILVGDIERGGVIAALAGTLQVISREDRGRIAGTLINRFRGDATLFESGMDAIARHTGLPVFGPLPYFPRASLLPAEDVLALDRPAERHGRVHVVVPRLSRIANFDDLDPLAAEPDIRLEIVPPGMPLPRSAELVILPGSKATMADLEMVRAEGWDIDILAHERAGGRILGLCGGYQMLGKLLSDPQAIEGRGGSMPGLGLLEVETILTAEKQLRIEAARHAGTGTELSGYHMHLGVTEGPDRMRPFARLGDVPEGSVSANGRIMGTYLHGIFSSDTFRRAFLAMIGAQPDPQLVHESLVDRVLDELADHISTHLDIDGLLSLAKTPKMAP